MTGSLLTAARTHPGCVRERNEDAFLARPDLGLWLVADGMGGHNAGDHASGSIVRAFDGLGPQESARALLRAVRETLAACHAALQDYSRKTGALCGSTAVVLLAFDSHFACLWAGDSRLYRWRGGRLQQLSRDHSVVQAMVERGEIEAEQARHHPFANQLTRALGIEEPIEFDVFQDVIEPGDRFLLCSDGLTGPLDDPRIEALIAAPGIEQAADDLLAAALAAGARDNVTFVIVAADGSEEDDLERTRPRSGPPSWS